jgi:hypothetical protein
VESSDDESTYLQGNGGYRPVAQQRWWITQLLLTIITTITTSTSRAYRSIVGPSHRYPYTERRPTEGMILSCSYPFPTLSGVGTTWFSSCCDKELTNIACLTSILLEIGVDANDCKCSWDQRLNVPSEARRSSS